MSSDAQGIPVLVYGRGAQFSKEVAAFIAPEYDVVISCLLEDDLPALTEIPAVLRGEEIVPHSGLGSNIKRGASDLRIPRAVIFGGLVSEEHAEQVKAAAAQAGVDANSVRWVHVRGNPTDGPPTSKQIADKIKAALRDVGL